ncbi:alpha-(1,3)-fucosyltransferase 7-like [Stylophora pistillata]|uniref:alpha-(1,3)-fucosyltransferase 7-like n=1 Tax=Stylophora pistillata TaxID=50429 RepID=UPI000C04BBAC|nr:alpha-(1,3)-fucosyltransferase 7-like [Stylophora pistillata]
MTMVGNWKTRLLFYSITLGSSLLILKHWFLYSKIPLRKMSNQRMSPKLFFNSEPQTRRSRNDLKLVLFYTTLFGERPWQGLINDYNFTNWNGIPCGVQACRISYNRKDLDRSDAVIFHGRDLPSVHHMKRIMKYKTPHQRWVYFIHESPKFTYYEPWLYNGFFNWTMSYRRDSDFFVPYRTYTRLQPDEIANEETQDRNYALSKDRLVVWVVSNCHGLREEFVKKLMKYVKVDVYGRCSRRFNQTETCPRQSSACEDTLKRYKFILSFENSYCSDYVTEKYWYTPLDRDIVPVVFGGASYDQKIAIPGSFINVLDFPSIKTLADYLLFLDRNDKAYNGYFSWRKRFKPVLPESWTCHMCAALNNNSIPSKIQNNLEEFWGERSNCATNERRIRKLVEKMD